MPAISMNYDISLLVFSILIAFLSSYVALDISSRLQTASGTQLTRWILSGATVMGLGVWAMHFIAMLALHFSMPVNYNLALVVLSILPVFASFAVAFYMISKPEPSNFQQVLSIFLVAVGVIAMHYLGMAAMQMGADLSYKLFPFALSIVMAFATSYVAFLRLMQMRDVPGFHWRKAANAALMGTAIAGFHHIAMEAAVFSPIHQHTHLGITSVDGKLIGNSVGIGVLLIINVAFNSLRSDRRLMSQTEESERKFDSVIDSAHDAIIVADELGNIIRWNHGATVIFGYEKEEVLGLSMELIVPERFRIHPRSKNKDEFFKLLSEKIGKITEFSGIRKDGQEFPLELSFNTWEAEKSRFYSYIIRDISERKQSEEKINSLVYLDPLTGLPNRRLFQERLAEMLEIAEEQSTMFSLLYLDLDHFKLINDTLGHSIGDQLLVEAADRLQQHTTKKDLIARLGGDEFVFLLPHAGQLQAAEFAQKLLDSFDKPFRLNGEDVFVTLSIGISLYQGAGQNQETLIQNADLALYRMKDEGRNGFHFHTNEMNEVVVRKSKLASSLRKGLENNEFFIVYQPQIDLKTGQISGVEALVRWNHPKLGTVSPAEFIPLAEETGSIIQIGEFVLREACQQNKAWQDAGLPPFRVAVNISARQFTQTNLTETVKTILEKSGLAPEYLELELTESIIQGAKSSIATMQELKAMGIHLSIDDFGTGYSSLSYLKLFPIDSLKIDQYFTRNIQIDEKDASLVDTIIRMAHNLKLSVIAEGVETEEQLAFLNERQCDHAQGYYFNKPLLAEEIEKIYSPTYT